MTFSSENAKWLSDEIQSRLSKKRFNHTEGVVKMATYLGRMCIPDKVEELICAAYLHDVTKELPVDIHYNLISLYDLQVSEEDLKTEAVLHSFSAFSLVKRDFSHFATPDILSAVFNHTLGAPDMSVFDEVIFLADFIEEGRSYEGSVNVRDFTLSKMKDGEILHNVKVLHEACVMAIDNTVFHLIEEKRAINTKNILTRNALLGKI